MAFINTNILLLQTNIDTTFSGSTTVLVLILENSIYTANIGDSRAVLAKLKQENHTFFSTIMPYCLSNDHKPDSPLEYKRIIEKGGRVDTYYDN